MTRKYSVLMFGASYGSLFGVKLALAGHDVTMVCLPAEVEAINRDGVRVILPLAGREGGVELQSKNLEGRLSAAAPQDVDPADFDLIGLAMQEPQFSSPGVRELLDAAGRSERPCVSIMNMPPPPYLARIPGVDVAGLTDCYAEPGVWASVKPENITLCSPDAQAFRPPDQPVNVLQVGLPTNFKAARFERDADTHMLQSIAEDIAEALYEVDGAPRELPVKLKVHNSVFTPLAKWCMLIAGNYRCVGADGPRSIRDAVHADIETSREVYDWVAKLCVALGAAERDLVAFEKYAEAAKGLLKPSSAARALFAGAQKIERVDKLVQTIGRQQGRTSPLVDDIVRLVDAQLERNRAGKT